MKRLLHPLRTAALLAAAAVAALAQAAGVLYTNDKTGDPQPLRWDTRAPIPVYTDLGVFTYDFDGSTPFVSNAQITQVVKFALAQWSAVPTSTLRAQWAGDFTQVPTIGGDVTATNADKVIGRYNGGGMHVIYDTDGSLLENVFGVPRDAVLGIAFPEWSVDTDGDGQPDTITEATAILNGWAVGADDPQAARFAGVVTHEFGHAFNLSHSQVNGQMAYFSYPGFADLYPGVPGCVAPKHRYDWLPEWGGDPMPTSMVETMFPFINVYSAIGQDMSTIDRPDDQAAISNLYPTPAYTAGTGTITGVLRLKDGRTPYSGVNIIARSVADPLGDAVSGMSGDRTQGKVGPDGRFTIRGLKPGHSYLLYMEQIVAGGYPTQPRALVSEAEYWNVAESANPVTDKPCDATPVVAAAGAPAVANLTFNGYAQGVQYSFIVDALLVDLAKNGGRASGIFGATQFVWDAARGFEVMPPNVVATTGSMTRNGQQMLVASDFNRNGINSLALWSSGGKLRDLGSLNGDTCGGSSESGVTSTYGFAIDDSGRTAVGLAYVDADGDGYCEASNKPEIVPVIWTDKGGLRRLDATGHNYETDGWLRAQAVSGDGSVVLGDRNASAAVAWVNEGRMIDLFRLYGAQNAYAVNIDGTRAAFDTIDRDTWIPTGAKLWNAKQPGTAPRSIGSLRWCIDMPLYTWFEGDVCALYDAATVQQLYGLLPMQVNDMSDDGKVVIGRAGSFWLGGLTGAMWVDGIGWIKLADFFRRQGVPEAYRLGLENPLSINGAGNEMVGGLVGVSSSWYVDMKQVFVCENGQSVQTGFPNGFVAKVKAGAKMGRCEHL